MLFVLLFGVVCLVEYFGLTIQRPWVPKYGTYYNGNYIDCHYRHDERSVGSKKNAADLPPCAAHPSKACFGGAFLFESLAWPLTPLAFFALVTSW